MDFSKTIITLFISLHLLPNVSLPKIKFNQTPIPQATNQTSPNLTQNGLTISDEVDADRALQHELDHVSIYYFDGNPKNTISINPDKAFDPASTIKLYVAMYAFDQVAAGNIDLNQTITVQAKNVAPSQSFPNGYSPLNANDTVSVYELLDRMITQSGNTSYNTLVDLLDRTKITKYIHDLGLVNSSIGSKLNLDGDQEAIDVGVAGFGLNTTNVDDYARAFILINGKRLPGSASLFDILTRQKFNSMIPALLPKEVTVAHKTGELDPYYHDGGIVVAPNKRRYVLSVFSNMGSPDVVAHISNLIYTNDTNIVGNNAANKNTVLNEEPNAPIDPLVALGEPQNTNVLAANTENIKEPKFSASDIGITAKDISGTLSNKQLPFVLIPADSPLHFLIDIGTKLRVTTNPIPAIRANFEAENLKLKLAEANDLISRKKETDANIILSDVNKNLAQIAKENGTSSNPALQSSLKQISETRFSILGQELTSSQNKEDKIQTIKNITHQPKNTLENIKPYIKDALPVTNLSQTPVVGKVIARTGNSVTVKTAQGENITSSFDNGKINSRNVGETDLKIIDT